jgi:hypothetical protein
MPYPHSRNRDILASARQRASPVSHGDVVEGQPKYGFV